MFTLITFITFALTTSILVHSETKYVKTGDVMKEDRQNKENGQDWWQKTVIYQIYPRSFRDSDGDGLGDLKGIESYVDHFVDAGIEAVWLSPIYKSPMVDFGYDISNFVEIYEKFGTMKNFESLIQTFRSKGIRVLLDFVPNHSSDQHVWFQKSKQNVTPYNDYYVWHDGVDGKPPNNWISNFEGSAWEYAPERGQYYLHQFAAAQPDLNYRNPLVREEMDNVLRFWLDKGVNGFRVDAVNFLIEDGRFRDEPVLNNDSVIPGYSTYNSLDHIRTKDLNETYDQLGRFRRVLDNYTAKTGETKVMLVEAYTTFDKTIEYYGNQSFPIAHAPFNFDFITSINISSNARDFDRYIVRWLDQLQYGRWPNWVIGNHDNSRAASRFGPEMANSLTIMITLLPGTSITYNGDEIGMVDGQLSFNETVDPRGLSVGPKYYMSYSRDPERTPMQWNNSVNAGFSNASKTWLPVNPNYWHLNLRQQKKKGKSWYKIYKNSLKLRNNDNFRFGKTDTHVLSDWVFSYTRTLNNVSFVFVINIDSETSNVTLRSKIKNLNDDLKVYISSINSEHTEGDILKSSDSFTMRPKSALVLGPKNAASLIGNSVITILILTVSVIVTTGGYRWLLYFC